jgi:hypothetical protein
MLARLGEEITICAGASEQAGHNAAARCLPRHPDTRAQLGAALFFIGYVAFAVYAEGGIYPPGELMRGQPSPRGREASSPHP